MEQNKDESFNMEDIVVNNNMLLNTLIDILVEKDIISEEELMKKVEEQAKEMEAEESDCDDDDCSDEDCKDCCCGCQ